MNKLRKIPSIAQTILAILHDVGKGTLQSFFPHPYSRLFCNHRNKNSFQPALTRLRNSRLIARDKSDIFYLTKKGEKEAFISFINAEVSSYTTKGIAKPKWDGKWRMILFDIPEKKKAHREYLRSVIKSLGFKEFQRSVWAYPYRIPGFLTELLADEDILPYTRFITTTSIDYDDELRKLFNL